MLDFFMNNKNEDKKTILIDFRSKRKRGQSKTNAYSLMRQFWEIFMEVY